MNSQANRDTMRLGYVPALDGLRGIAALGVLLIHYLNRLAETRPLISFRGGHFGVDVFFALSGFLITTLLVEEFQRRGTIGLRDFWIRRALRLLPALILVLVTLVLLGSLVETGMLPYGQGLTADPGGPGGGLPWSYLPFWPGIAVSLLPVSNWVWVAGHQFNPFGIGWTLAIEDQFYLVWPFLLALLLIHRRVSLRLCAAIIVALAVAAVVWRNYLWWNAGLMVYQRTDFHAAELLIGCACGLVVAAGLVPTGHHARQILGALAWASLVGILIMYVRGEPLYANVAVVLIAVLTVVLITHLVVTRDGRLTALLSWPPLVGIGQVSYGLYLWHWVWLQYPLSVDAVQMPMIGIVLTSAAVLVSYYFVERPALRLKRRFASGGIAAPGAASGERTTITRRNLLPLLGMGSVTVAALAAYSLSERFYPRPVVAAAAEDESPPAPTPRHRHRHPRLLHIQRGRLSRGRRACPDRLVCRASRPGMNVGRVRDNRRPQWP